MTTNENITLEPLASPTYLYHYNLQEDPFSSGCTEKYFYLEPDRKQFLDLLLQLSQHGEQSLLITGVAGSGKTCLLEHLLNHAEPHWKICQIDAENIPSPEDLFQFIIISFGLTENQQQTLYPSAPSLDELKSELINICQHQLPLLIIDNAHALSPDALEIILHLSNLENNGSRLISTLFFSKPEINHKLEDSRFRAINTLQRLDMPTLDREHTRLYIQHRLMTAGYQGKPPLSKRQFKKLHQDSEGSLGQLNTLAQIALIHKISTDKGAGETTRKYKLGAISLTMLSIILLTGSLVFQQDTNPQLDSTSDKNHIQTHALVPLPAVNRPEPLIVAMAPPTPVTDHLNPAETAPQTVPPENPAIQTVLAQKLKSINAGDNIADEPQKTAAAVLPTITNRLQGKSWLDSQPEDHYTLQLLATHRKAGLEEFTSQYQLTSPVAALAIRSDNDTLHILVQGQYASRAKALVMAKSLPEEIQRLSPWPRRIGQLKALLVSPVQAKTAVSPVEVLKGTAWLWSRDPSQYTIQLMAADNRQAIIAFSKTLTLTQPLAYLQTQRNNKPWHILVYGEFDGETAARKAIKQLPTPLRKVKPWPRGFGSVHEALSSASKTQQ